MAQIADGLGSQPGRSFFVTEGLVKAGVIDPTKVIPSTLQNAASIASLLLTTEAMVPEIPEKKEAPAPGGGPGGMGGMY